MKEYKVAGNSCVIIIVIIMNSLLFCSCSLIKKAAGADFDVAAYQKAREARITEIKMRETTNLLKRIANNKPIGEADIALRLSGRLLNKIAGQYVGIKGWIDEDNSFVTDSIHLSLQNGYCIASLKLTATNHSYGVDARLVMDCLASLKYKGNELYLNIEPFNISPDVKTGFLLSGLKETIQNLLLLNLGEMGSKFKGLKIPMNIDNDIKIGKGSHKVTGIINAEINLPEIVLPLDLKLAEIIFLEGEAIVSFDFINSNRK